MGLWTLAALIMSGIAIKCSAFILGGARFSPGSSVIRRNLNRLLCDQDEVITNEATKEMTVLLKKGDQRAKHIKEVYFFVFFLYCAKPVTRPLSLSADFAAPARRSNQKWSN